MAELRVVAVSPCDLDMAFFRVSPEKLPPGHTQEHIGITSS